MDQQPIRRARGKSRGLHRSSQQQTEGAQQPQDSQQTEGLQRPQHLQQMQKPQQPQQSQQMQRPPYPKQMQGQRPMQAPQQMPAPQQVQTPRPQGVFIPRPTGEASRPRVPAPQQVEQVTAMMGSMTTTTDLVPIGRGAVRGRRTLDTVQYNRVPRPESSKSGKQGVTGQPIQLIANYFPITSEKTWSLYQYKVNFNPEEDRIGIKRGLLSNHKGFLGPYIFDGESMFSRKKYDSNNIKLTSKRNSDNQFVIMSITFVSVIETNDYANIQVFNLLLRNCLKHLELKLVGRNYYDALAKIDIPEHNIELWPGYETTIGLFDNGLLLRTEISTKVMRQETVLDFFNQCLRNRDPKNDYMMKFKAGVIGTVVLTPYNNKTYRIDDVDDTSDINSTFEMKDGTVTSYKNYYAERWQCESLYDGKQPLLVSKKKRSLIYGNDEEDLVYLVPEFCTLTGLTDAMRNNFRLMKDMAEHTRVGPQKRIDKYYNFSRRLQSKPECLQTFNNWDLGLGHELIKIPGRVLPIEKLNSNNTQYDGGNAADWSRTLRSLPMYASAVMKRWVIITPNVQAINAFVSTLQKVGRTMSFSLPRPEIVELRNLRNVTARDYVICLEKVINERNPSFILCVTTSPRNDIYNIIKRKLCVDRAVPSQIVLLKNVEKNDMSVCTKIAIQINCKLGGAPWLVQIPITGLMVVGFDVCHDSCNKSVSYGALVASLNDTHTSYFSCVQPHRSGEELSTHFPISIAKALNKYKSKNGALPKSIIIYRDGVGDGQLSYVYAVEVENIKNTLKKFYGKEPPFAFIVVKKRISTRFFTNGSGGADPKNPQPGTVIDQVITDPSMYDFFLVSQNVRFGTVTPTHYNIIEDTLVNWSPDRMQRLTYKLTHMYYNWSGTVKVPAHCQLAHKLAFLTAQSLKTSPNTGLDELLYFL